MAVIYEWAVEVLDEPETGANDPDALDVHHCGSYAEAKATAELLKAAPTRIVLVRDVGNDAEGLTDRAWAYVRDGKLPDTFTYGADEDSGIDVPARFHKEVTA